jgi:transcriptional regulator with XRE-family HTH domain
MSPEKQARLLKALREERELSARVLAQRFGCSEEAVMRARRAHGLPREAVRLAPKSKGGH